MEKQTITIYDVAREANVSMATVSRVVMAIQTSNQQQEKKSWKLSIAWIIVQTQLRVAWQVRKQQQLG